MALFIDSPYEDLKPAFFAFLTPIAEAVLDRLKEYPEYDYYRTLSILLPYFVQNN